MSFRSAMQENFMVSSKYNGRSFYHVGNIDAEA